mmetsp:Transcript_55946/g.65362  ORF Transcript_55946/g.65362 Transcript_55946/m.65362 type:complete len:103 (+) Transcript_55946:3-311(+)
MLVSIFGMYPNLQRFFHPSFDLCVHHTPQKSNVSFATPILLICKNFQAKIYLFENELFSLKIILLQIYPFVTTKTFVCEMCMGPHESMFFSLADSNISKIVS